MKLDVQYGFSCGRHWIKIGDKVIAQTPGDDVWMRDADVCDLARAVIPGCEWKKAFRLDDGIIGVDVRADRPLKGVTYEAG